MDIVIFLWVQRCLSTTMLCVFIRPQEEIAEWCAKAVLLGFQQLRTLLPLYKVTAIKYVLLHGINYVLWSNVMWTGVAIAQEREASRAGKPRQPLQWSRVCHYWWELLLYSIYKMASPMFKLTVGIFSNKFVVLFFSICRQQHALPADLLPARHWLEHRAQSRRRYYLLALKKKVRCKRVYFNIVSLWW